MSPQKRRLLLLIACTALVMRAPVNAVGPMASDICSLLGLSWQTFGFLTSLPVVIFGLCSLTAPVLTRRFGQRALYAGALLFILAGSLLRSAADVVLLFGGTLLISFAIANLNVLMPALIKEKLAADQEKAVGLYGAMIGVSSLLGAACVAPLKAVFPLWSSPFLFWGAAAALCLIFVPVLQGRKSVQTASGPAGKPGLNLRLTVILTGMIAFQAMAASTVSSWLAAYFTGVGASESDALWVLNAFLFSMIAGALVWGFLTAKRPAGYWLLFAVTGLYVSGLLLWAFLPLVLSIALPTGLILGLLQGMLLTASYSAVTKKTPVGIILTISGRVQFGGYLIGGCGPLLAGLLIESAGFAGVPFFLIGVVLLWCAFAAAGSRLPDTH